jgi:hypothetical protein
LDIKHLWIQDFVRRKKCEILKVLTDVNWADIGTKALTKARLEELLAMMPITRKEGLDWGVKACTALAFLATLEVAEANNSLVVVESALTTTNEPNTTWKPRLIVALAAYMLVLHVLAVMTLLRGWSMLCGRRSVAVGDDLRTEATTGVQTLELEVNRVVTTNLLLDNRQQAALLLAEFRNDQLREMCRERRLATAGRKDDLIATLLNSRSRANDEQCAQINRLRVRNFDLDIRTSDIETVAAATSWISLATTGQLRRRAVARAT